jgi:hypothetical protein
MRNIAKRLMAHEANEEETSATKNPAIFPVFEKLSPHLATLMGTAGFRGLLVRSITLTGEEIRWVRALHVASNGSLTGFEELPAQLAPKLFFEGKTVLLAQLLGLLVVFMGEDLTLRLLGRVWPKLPLGDLDFGKGDLK